ncbi:MAG: CGNR zinc finger domain-containing protein [Pseudomonadota bacterium]|nr:CGNR zinc finger domain-containing protein [Pseudomonadota bacterium]
MTRETRPAPFFVGEHPALDLLNSVATPHATRFDWLETGADLLDWMIAAKLASEAELAPFRDPACADGLEAARQRIVTFREDFRTFIEGACGTPLSASDHPMIGRINGILAKGARYLQITKTGPEQTFALTDRHRLDAADDLIMPIAAAAAHLICEGDFRYIRNCEGPTCTLYFLDVSKNHKRRWCSMEVCGNRAKAAAYRNR